MTLTEPGRRLLEQLDQPNIRELLDRYAKPSPKRSANRTSRNRRR